MNVVADARHIATALGGQWSGHLASCACPIDGANLTISQTGDGRPLLRCYGGCDQGALIGHLRERRLWPPGPVFYDPAAPQFLTIPADGMTLSERKERLLAEQLWALSEPLEDTAAEAWLEMEGVARPREWPGVLLAHRGLRDPELAATYPCLIAGAHDADGALCAIWRCYVRPERRGASRIIGPLGDSAVRLGKPAGVLGLAVGVVDALLARQTYAIPVWAVLRSDRLGAIAIPPGVEQVWLFPEAGPASLRCARAAVDRYSDQGYRCLIQVPEDGCGDHNDAIRAGRAA